MQNKENSVEEIPGLFIIEDFITNEEEKSLLSYIDKEPWSNALKRRTQHYGYEYNYQTRSLPQKLGDLPKWTNKVVKDLVNKKIFTSVPTQMIVNEYQPGQGISKHIDQPRIFGPIVASLSLGSSCVMTFENKNIEYDMLLKPKSLTVLTEKSRYEWYHSIPARKSDMIEENDISRTRRVSLTFRSVVN